MDDNLWNPVNNYPPPKFGRYAKEDPTARYPPRAPQPGPPPGEDYDTLTAQHGTPRRNLAAGTKGVGR